MSRYSALQCGMDSFMTFAVEFFVWAGVALLGVWFIGFLLQPLGFLLELVGKPAKPKPAARFYCTGAKFSGKPYPGERTHTHKTTDEADACLYRWIAAEVAEGASKPQPAACGKCGRNHFAEDCPGHRATDGRTGEVVGYWVPKS